MHGSFTKVIRFGIVAVDFLPISFNFSSLNRIFIRQLVLFVCAQDVINTTVSQLYSYAGSFEFFGNLEIILKNMVYI